ncbi:MAG TPA: hypothetical protein VLX30_05890 [Burkholderiales bacterium]|nr:hypothetical protein [Burkholderiales bacterium]
MQKPLVRMVKLNGLQYNANRDPQAYRRAQGEAFQLEALLEGAGEAQCSVSDERGGALAQASVARPGRFACELKFDRPGSRLVTLRVRAGESEFAQTLRLDVMAHAWVG